MAPVKTVAPAKPASRALRTIASYAGRPSHLSASPTKMRSRQPCSGIFMLPTPSRRRARALQFAAAQGVSYHDQSESEHVVRKEVQPGPGVLPVAELRGGFPAVAG